MEALGDIQQQLDATNREVERLKGELIEAVKAAATARTEAKALKNLIDDAFAESTEFPWTNEGLPEGIKRIKSEREQFRQRAEKCEAELSEASKDRARLDWVQFHEADITEFHGEWQVCSITPDSRVGDGPTARQAIDAAMEGK